MNAHRVHCESLELRALTPSPFAPTSHIPHPTPTPTPHRYLKSDEVYLRDFRVRTFDVKEEFDDMSLLYVPPPPLSAYPLSLCSCCTRSACVSLFCVCMRLCASLDILLPTKININLTPSIITTCCSHSSSPNNSTTNTFDTGTRRCARSLCPCCTSARSAGWARPTVWVK